MSSEVFQLHLLLTLKDHASGGLNRVEAQLRGMGKEGRETLRTFQALREDLKRDTGISAIGVGTLMAMRKGVQVAGDYEAAMADLRMSIQELGTDGRVNTQKLANDFGQLESVGVRLGNRLPGTTQDFVEMFSTLKQGGLTAKTIIDGAGESVANLAVVTHEIPKDLAEPFAQYAQQFSLTGDEAIKLSDTLSRIRFATGLRPQELIEGSKFFQLRAGLPLGFTGLQGADTSGRLLATLRSYGLEGGIGGRELGGFMLSLNFNTKEKLKMVRELEQAKGIKLKFFDDKGAFLGIENVFRQMEQFRKLSTQDQMKFGEKLFDREGMAIASVFTKSGLDGWTKINQKIDKVPPLQELINQKTETYNAKLESVKGTLTNLEATAFSPMLDTLKPILDLSNQVAGSLQGWSKTNAGVTQTVGTLVGITGVTLTVVGGVRAMTTAWRLWRIASSVGVSETGQLTFMRAVRTEATATSTALGAATTRASGFRKALGGIPAQIGVMIALEYTISKGLEYYEAIKEYRKADAGVTRAGTESLSSLTKLREDYAKRGEEVPSSVYDARAGDMLRAAKDQGIFSGVFRATSQGDLAGGQKHFLNPYGIFYPEPNFIKQNPELGDSRLMKAFLDKLSATNLGGNPVESSLIISNARKALEQAFPQSFQQATQPLLKGLTDLQQPILALPDPLKKTGDAAGRAASGLDRFTNRLDGAQIPNFSNLAPGATTPGATTPSLFPKTSFTPRTAPPTRAVAFNQAGGSDVHHHHGNRTVHLSVHGVRDPEEIARLAAHALEIQLERAA